MQLWPAIDLRGGRCVRLLQGDYDRETVFGADPVVMAERFVAAGARRLHIVDLDGAKDGRPTQADLVARIVAAAGVPCQLGGGVRTLATARHYLAAGVRRVVVGSVAIEQPDLLVELAETFPNRIVLGLDARDGRVAVRGWLETSDLTALDVARRHASLPLAAIVYTDIATDGMLSGPNLPALEEMAAAVSLPVVASGGVADADDIAKVATTGCAGCIVGRALYEGAVTIADAVAAAGEIA
ncbi:MAG: 1-(5-phosphoribosyl)-5-[(5-phosphoribosylamino)methylideneamino]imidazole-4-carboxamide isomerase [Planctomycetota bacterium]|jgi:phosphoribosylformimino-5-aminoimidazole carboxamide ribotide isomerase|nr:1-(5-phosphoribosyl)-5-[(5-phosphoribosylamino)methylideneamino]imidazole-4-carboxamide isomerase [Acidimicrobiales bacterium]MDA0254207.1 1-(5-phosphoribosyl)-5-[(5-phosphoribosylamino)methylideneamino]imidazole-4-carboxamide isomerase [Planctomycetota bacterium]MDA1200620.1 1-(5-phosphoribosyl)-5-[(5-phosphoribosylamino)methylideneamino]imidazole-4-carboxamide isomerase [Planctomycetota bacterium]